MGLNNWLFNMTLWGSLVLKGKNYPFWFGLSQIRPADEKYQKTSVQMQQEPELAYG